jgi:hypothetical protein
MPSPGEYAETRETLHRVAAHVLARRRYEVTRRFGLRASPGGFGTPAFGDPLEVLRITRGVLVRERGCESAYAEINGSTLRELANFAGADIDAEFRCGDDTPPTGDIDEKLLVNDDAIAVLGGWFQFGWQAIDSVIGGLPDDATPGTIQLWPEHFDAGTNVAVAPDVRLNLGASPGDAFSASPYIYVGPWSAERPGDPRYWNAPFGAVLRREDLKGDPLDAAVRFLHRGLDLIREAS